MMHLPDSDRPRESGALLELLKSAGDKDHFVQFYESDDNLCEAVTEFLASGLSAGEPLVIIATEPHRRAFCDRLRSKGIDVERACAEGDIKILDAHEALSSFMVGSIPDREHFDRVIGGVLEESAARSRGARVRAYGEMVDVLWRQGERRAAIQLEGLWDRLQARRSFSLYCSYVMGSLHKEADLRDLCAAHTHVFTPRRAQPHADEASLMPAGHARALAAEIAQRKEVEKALRRSIEDLERARLRGELLYRLARSVIEAQRVEDVFEAALTALEEAVGAQRSSILVFDAGGVMRFRAWRGLSDRYRRAVEGHSPWARDAKNPAPILVQDVEGDAAMESYLPLFRAEHIGALGFIPLVASGRLLGKFMVYYEGRRALSSHELELAMAIANHVAAAVARFSAVDELQQTVRFNEMFMAILGHDLRNPLAGIWASAQLAMTRDTDGKLMKPLSRIMNSGERMARMIDQLLDFARARVGGGIPLQPAPIDLVPLLREVLDELGAANPAVALHLEHAGDTAGVWDADRLCQIFSNLAANAVSHGASGDGVRVRVDGTIADSIRVHVHNMGAVPPEVLPRIFEPMMGGERRGDNSKGLGLGLFITQQLVQAHGGGVEVQSEEATGTTFTVSLPRRVAATTSAS